MIQKGARVMSEDMFTPERTFEAEDIQVPSGYSVELVAKELTYPTDAAFDDEGNLYVIEAGYSYGPDWTESRLLKLRSDGSFTTVHEGGENGPWNGVTFHDGYFFVAEGGHSEGGRILKISKSGEEVQVLADGLPSLGDHHTNGPVAGSDGWIYFGQGTATNSGVVGNDNWRMGWLGENEEFADIPCEDVTLSGKNYSTPDPFSDDPADTVSSGPYKAVGETARAGEVIQGQVPCSGAVMRVNRDGDPVELVAWGFRNPYGLAFGPDNQLYVVENGFDARGSRKIVGGLDHLWRVIPGEWYGWPDYSGGIRLDDPSFVREGEIPADLLLQEYPGEPPEPVAVFGVHSSSSGLVFVPEQSEFGVEGDAFIAQFGDMTPVTGNTISPVGYQIVRVNVHTGETEEFALNKKPGPGSASGTGGFERPLGLVFSPDGDELYIVDFGMLIMSPMGPLPEPDTGSIWKITRKYINNQDLKSSKLSVKQKNINGIVIG
ncbi:MAG: PQQ-dependent sugar dehydrogenase [Balneolaceae bacterium]